MFRIAVSYELRAASPNLKIFIPLLNFQVTVPQLITHSSKLVSKTLSSYSMQSNSPLACMHQAHQQAAHGKTQDLYK